MPQQIGVLSNCAAVDCQLPFILENMRRDGNVAVAVFRLCFDMGRLRPHADKLLIVADTKGSARTKVKHRFRAVGFPLTVFPEQHVQPFGKREFFPFVVSKILQE